jgi:fucose permease
MVEIGWRTTTSIIQYIHFTDSILYTMYWHSPQDIQKKEVIFLLFSNTELNPFLLLFPVYLPNSVLFSSLLFLYIHRYFQRKSHSFLATVYWIWLIFSGKTFLQKFFNWFAKGILRNKRNKKIRALE